MKKTLFKKSMAWLLALMMVITFIPAMAFAEDEAPTNPVVPFVNKTLDKNEDGTYEIEMSITGNSTPPDQTKNVVNVLVVYDVSSSMDSHNAPGTRHSRADEAENVVNGFLQQLYDKQNNSDGTIVVNTALVTFAVTANAATYRDENNEETYWIPISEQFVNQFDKGTGDGYNFDYTGTSHNGTNWDHALQVSNTVLGQLGENSVYPTFVMMITDGAPTASGTTGNNPQSPDIATFAQLRARYEAARGQAKTIQGIEKTNLYGIYAYGNEADLLDDMIYWSFTGEEISGGATRDTINETDNPEDYEIIKDNYFGAADTDQLTTAINTILDQIVKALGVTNVEINDGTPSQVEASTGVVNLLHVDETSYKYFLTFTLDENGNFKDNQNKDVHVEVNGSTATLTRDGVKVAEYTVVPPKESSEEPSEDPSEETSATTVKVVWDKAQDFYPAPPEAVFEDGGVKWNLNKPGYDPLLNNVTYSYAFACSPSQYTYDLIADLENGIVEYGDERYKDVWDYINEDYELTTNTTDTTVKYVDSRVPNVKPDLIVIDPLEPVPTDSSSMKVKKIWDNDLDDRTGKPIQMKLTRDGEKIATLNLGPSDKEDENWATSQAIATGQISVDESAGTVNVFAEGHDYTLEEVGDQTYYWELRIDTIRPMIVNGTLTTLIKVKDEDAPAQLATKDFYNDGKDKYYKIKVKDKDGTERVLGIYKAGSSSDAELTATNHRRSVLDLTKKVEGAAAPDKAFKFSIKVDDPNKNDLWFSVKDAPDSTGQRVYDLETDATPEIRNLITQDKLSEEDITTNDDGTYTYPKNGEIVTSPAVEGGNQYDYYTGYYSFKSGNTVYVKLKDNWNLRLTNLMTGTTYDITEDQETMPADFELESVELVADPAPAQESEDDGEGTVDDETAEGTETGDGEEANPATFSGSIENPNTTYTLTYTNKYVLTSAVIEKTFKGITSEQIPTDFSIAVTAGNQEMTLKLAEGEGVIAPDSTPVTDENGNITYTWTINGLTNGTKVTATENPGTAPTGYSLKPGTETTGEIEKTTTENNEKITFINEYLRDKGTLTVKKQFSDIPKDLITEAFKGAFQITIADLNNRVLTLNDNEGLVISADKLTYTWTIPNVDTGSYTVKESNMKISGYDLATDSVQEATAIVVKDSAQGGQAAELKNKYTKKTSEVVVHDSITINKVDQDQKALTGATFTLKKGDTTVQTYNGGSFPISTSEQALKDYLPKGGETTTLTLTETKVPDGYEDNTTTYNVVIGATESEVLDATNDEYKTTITYTITINNQEKLDIVNKKKSTNPPPIHIEPEPVPLDLNGVDHFAYIEGYPDGTVQPEGNITRAEVATMIYRLLTFDRRDEIFTSECNYSDVAAKNWFNKAVASMTAGEYVEGYPDGSFLPNQKITRAEFVTIVVRFLEGERDAENPFTDIDSHWAKKYILSAVDAGWIDGYPDGTFRPQEPIKRDEAMKIMNTILHRGINEESELGEPVMFPDNADPSAWYYYEVIEATNNHDTEGERPDEDWLSNECEYEYDIVKYERPDGAAPAPQDDPEEQTTPDDQDEPAVTDNSIVGQWEYTEEGVDGAFVYTFNEDGTGNYDMAGTVKAFTYTIEGNTLSILYEGDTEPFELPFVVTDTTLTVKDSNDEDVVYNKK